jgi:Tannase and feruloyl esterase
VGSIPVTWEELILHLEQIATPSGHLSFGVFMNLFFTASSIASLFILASCATNTPNKVASIDLKTQCASLSGQVIDAKVIGSNAGLASGNAVLTSATFFAASSLVVAPAGPTPAATITPAMPDHCRALGKISPIDPKAPDIQFQVNLPVQWNGRSVQFGGGGFNGVLITGLGLVPGARYDAPAPLAQGYVTYGTDSGHQNTPNVPVQAFALNDEALNNFAHQAYKKVRDVAVALMQTTYGKAPEKLYFVGSSEGGREGLTMAQRYPKDFNGVFSRVPVIHWTGLQHAGLKDGLALMNGGWLNPAQVKLVHNAVLQACDADDGLADGVISHVKACASKFNYNTLLCKGDAADTCLTPKQVAAIRTLNAPIQFSFSLPNGVNSYPGRGPSGEDTLAYGPTGGWLAWWTGKSAPTLPAKPDNGIAWVYGGGAISYFYANDGSYDINQYKPEDHQARLQKVASLMDSTNPDLSAFAAAGGKLIVLEHMADYAHSPYATIQYFESVQQRMGSAQVAQFAQLYTAPSVDHVGTGAPALFDPLGALVQWAEKGQAPNKLDIIEQNAKAPFEVLRARPLCQWPQWPRYIGKGADNADAKLASSFVCTQ